MIFTRPLKYAFVSLSLSIASVGAAQVSPVQKAVDEIHDALAAAVEEARLAPIVSIDHARLAAAEGVEMPPSRVKIFSDPAINTGILSENIRAGLDLPFRVLSYAQDGTAQTMHTSAEFLKIRHGLSDQSALDAFSQRLDLVARSADVLAAPTEGLSRDYGIIELTSALNVDEAVANLTDVVMAQGDTVWFGEIDFAAEAAQQGEALPDAVLLLFGGPAPGGVAMAKFPAIGLDAFCQKLLIYADGEGGSVVIFNDIAALAELHYGASAKPHHELNERLTATFRGAIQ